MAFRTREVVSAGGVVYRREQGDLEVLLLETSNGIWGLPKGTPEDGERLVETALREVQEETGLEVAAEDEIGAIEYWFVRAREQERYHKHVHFWLMRPLGGSLGQHDEEHVAIRWFALPAALQRVTHANTVEVLQKAATLLEGREATGAGA